MGCFIVIAWSSRVLDALNALCVSSLVTTSSIPSHCLFRCPLETHHPFYLEPDLGSKLICFCNRIWPQYPLKYQFPLIIPLQSLLSVHWSPLTTDTCSSYVTPPLPAYSGPGFPFAGGCQCGCTHCSSLKYRRDWGLVPLIPPPSQRVTV